MELIENIYSLVPEFVWQFLSAAGSICAILFIYFSSKYRNTEAQVKWYVLAFFFPFITSMVYLSQQKRYNKNIGKKVCPCCGDKYPPNFEICSRCLVELPEVDVKKQKLHKTLATAFLCAFIAFFLLDLVGGSVAVSEVVKDITGLSDVLDDADDYSDKIAVENEDGEAVYYDRLGIEYYDSLEVLLYDKDDNMYYFTYDGGKLCFYKEDGEYEWKDENLLLAEYCFVDKDGFFVYLEENTPVKSASEDTEYYFDAPYTDEEGNVYYSALEASWNSDSELITSDEQIK